MKKNGFTLIELIVVIGILTLLSSSLIVYSRTGEKNIIFFKEQNRIVSAIFRAKNLAVSTYGQGGSAASCGYGVYINPPQELIIFSDLTSSNDCSGADKLYSGSNENVDEKITLSPKVKIVGASQYILFIPPEPIVYPANNFSIKLEMDDGSKSATIDISSSGQIITFQ